MNDNKIHAKFLWLFCCVFMKGGSFCMQSQVSNERKW